MTTCQAFCLERTYFALKKKKKKKGEKGKKKNTIHLRAELPSRTADAPTRKKRGKEKTQERLARRR